MTNHLTKLALFAVPFVCLGAACAPECIDLYDCAEKAEKDGVAMTCTAGKCVAATPFDAGTGGGDGTTGGGDGMTGGGTGGGGDEDAGTGGTGGGGGDEDAGTGGGSATGGGTATGGGSATGGGTGLNFPVIGSYTATLTSGQAITGSTSTRTGSGTFTVNEIPDAGGYTFNWNITHTIPGGGVSGDLYLGIAGMPGTPFFSLPNASSPVVGATVLTAAQATAISEGRAYVAFEPGANEIRGQIIPAGTELWSARLGATPAFGGFQSIAPTDGGDAWYVGNWSAQITATGAAIHQGGAGEDGGQIIALTLGADGGAAGTFAPATLAAGDTDGGLYVEVGNADGGHIRGQLIKR